jgi:hypothetical protein
MAQPTTQELLDTGHAFYGYFWYANDTGLWDARNGAMATKTGSGTVTATGEGGANVANSTGTTYYSTGAVTSLGDPCTVGFKVKRTSASGDKGMVIGARSTTADYFWIRASEVRAFGLTTANSNPDSWATFHYVRLADGSGKLYKNGSYINDVPWRAPPPVDSIMDGYAGGTLALDGALEYMHIIPGLAATAGQISSLYSDPYQALDISSGASATFAITTDDATFSMNGKVSPICSFTATAADATFSGGASTGTASATFSATTADAAFSGTAVGDTSQGIITTPVLRNNTGTILASETGATAYVYNPTTGALVVKKTGQTTNGSGVMVITDALIVAATLYRVVLVLSSGAEGLDKLTAT